MLVNENRVYDVVEDGRHVLGEDLTISLRCLRNKRYWSPGLHSLKKRDYGSPVHSQGLDL